MRVVYKVRAGLLLCSVILSQIPATGRTNPELCGTHRAILQEELALSGGRAPAGKALRQRLARLAASDSNAGEIAVLGSGGGVVAQRNAFNLQGRSIGFVPLDRAATAYRFTTEQGNFDEGSAFAGQPVQGLGDDDYRAVELPFDFPFFGKLHRQAFVHSDGNLTFEEPDAASAIRSLGRMTAGPPRIAPQFADLDPSRAPDSVRISSLPDRVVITWWNVPEYSDFGIGPRQTIQLVLYPDGALQLTLPVATIGDVVTGIAPGRLSAPTSIVSFVEGNASSFPGAVVERFGSSERIDTTLAAQRFYQSHEDAYDYLVFFNALGIPAGANALASEITVRSYRKGIGDIPTEAGATYGSDYRLQAVLNMGPLTQYPLDPYEPVGLRGLITGDNTMTLLGHETGHLFLALASIRIPGQPDERPMLGSGLAHWSFNFNSEASLLEGNRIQDNGPTQTDRFTTIATVEGYSPLDQYLMGFRSPAEVPGTFVVYPSSTSSLQLPRSGVTFRGSRLDVTTADLIRDEGERIPDHTVSQRRFRFAFVLIVPEGEQPTAQQLEQLERYRTEFTGYFRRAAGERAEADPTLKRMLRVSAWPAGGVLQGRRARIVVTTAAPVGEDLQVQLSPTGPVRPPRGVTIPRGSSRVEFDVEGVSAGVGELALVPSDAAFETAEVRVPVAGEPADLKIILYFDGWSTVVRVIDRNEVPYSNLPLRIVDSAGPVTPLYGLTTDDLGFVYLDVAPGGIGNRRTFTVELEGAPETRVSFQLP